MDLKSVSHAPHPRNVLEHVFGEVAGAQIENEAIQDGFAAHDEHLDASIIDFRIARKSLADLFADVLIGERHVAFS